MLTQIETDGFKDLKIKRALTGLDLFTSKGLNGVGKSANLEIAQLISLGYLPNNGSGNTVESVMNYTSKESISVSGIYENGSKTTIKRTFLSRGKSKRLITLNGEELPYVEGQKEIGELLGFLPLMVDINEFLDMSDNKKKEFILRFSPEGVSWKKEDVFFVCEIKLITSKMQPGMLNGLIAGIAGANKNIKDLANDERKRLLESVISMSDTETRNTMWQIITKLKEKWNDSLDVQQNISSLVEYIKKEVSHYNRKGKENKTGAKKLLQATGDFDEIVGNIQDVKKALLDLETALTKDENQQSANNEKRKAVDSRDKNIERYQNNINTLSNKKYPVIEDLEPKIKELTVGIVGMDNRCKLLSDKKLILTDFERDAAKIKVDLKSINESIKFVAKNKVVCPLLKDVSCTTDLFGYAIELNRKKEELTNRLISLNIEIDQAKSIKLQLQKEVDDFESKSVLLSQHSKKLVKENSKKSNDGQSIKNHEEELQLLKKKMQNEEGLIDPEILTLKINGLKAQVETKKKESETLEQQKGILISEKKIKLEYAQDEIMLAYFKEANKILGTEGLQGEIVAAVKKPLENEVNSILSQIDPELVFAIDLSNGFKMGQLKKNNVLAPFETINDGHAVIFIAVFLTAIIKRKNPPLKLICIEGAELGSENLKILLSGFAKIKEMGFIDNVLVGHHQTLTESELPANWTQHIIG